MGIDPDPNGGIFLTKPYSPTSITINQNSSNPSDYQCRLFGIDDFSLFHQKAMSLIGSGEPCNIS